MNIIGLATNVAIIINSKYLLLVVGMETITVQVIISNFEEYYNFINTNIIKVVTTITIIVIIMIIITIIIIFVITVTTINLNFNFIIKKYKIIIIQPFSFHNFYIFHSKYLFLL